MSHYLRVVTMLMVVHSVEPYERIVFESFSRNSSVALFGKDIYSTRFSTSWTDVPLNKPPSSFHNYSLSEYVAVGKTPNYECVFGMDTVSKLGGIRTQAITVTYQIVTCPHPPSELRPSLIGKPVSICVGNKTIMNSTAVYKAIAPSQRKYKYCACLLMWYRSEFLLEWLWYHTVVHGLQKVYIYDNDSDIDKLKEHVDLLSHYFNLEYIPWTIHKIQPAYHGYCPLKAGVECDWVSVTDIDEFVYIDKGKRMVDYLASVSAEIGGLELRMVAISSGNTSMIRKPEGGVMRNYNCYGSGTNWKSVVRPEALHTSLVNAVHYYGYDYPRFKPKKSPPPHLYHFKTQAWEVYMRKYIRRASPATRSFKMPDKTAPTLDNPDPKWKKNVEKECSKPHTRTPLHSHAQCVLAHKLCEDDEPHRLQVAILGLGGIGSGLTWITKLLKKHNIFCVSLDWTTSRGFGNDVRFSKIVHHLRHPLSAIAALIDTSTNNDDMHGKLRKAVQSWVVENKKLEIVADARYRIEDISLEALCQLVTNEHEKCSKMPVLRPRIRFSAGESPSLNLTWAKLRQADNYTTTLAMDMARRYGYRITD
eukprot:m.71977 g.71977  ORF g.71977 m.71977 type:complete len:590 (+) comp12293_c1_seq1:178-1947(+)